MIERASAPPAWRDQPLTLGVSAFVFICIVFGGGGAEAPLRNGILEAFAAVLLCAAVAMQFTGGRLPPIAALPVWLLVGILTLIAAQLAPLPHQVWINLPGRETAVSVDELLGTANAWRPLSVDPEATRRAGSALFVPAAVLIAALQSNYRGLLQVTRAIVLGSLLSALFGAVQSSLGSPEYLSFYDRPEARSGAGFFANPNHQAQLLLAGILGTSVLIRLEQPQVNIQMTIRKVSFHLGWLLFPIFVVGVIATQSRAGLLLLFPAIVTAILIARSRKTAGVFLGLIGATVVLSVVAFLLTPESVTSAMRIQTMLIGEERVISLPDILFTVRQYWPWGAGLGTFVPVYMANENLDLLTGPYLNRAHNDLLELLVEAGLPGAILLGTILLLLSIRLVQVIRGRTAPVLAFAGFGMLTLMLLHSLVDYPLRTASLSAVAAVAVAFLISPAQKNDLAEIAARRRTRKGFTAFGAQRPSAGRGKRLSR